jgi:glycerophosphoryl diester phosphodiesterase
MKFYAHRGYSMRFPENTLPAFEAVLQSPCNGRSLAGIELDLQLSADNRIFIMHDIAMTDGAGRTVPLCTAPFSRILELYRLHHPDNGCTVPLFDQVLELVAHRTGLCLEIKEAQYDLERFTELLLESLGRYGPRGDVILSSFSYDIMRRMFDAAAHLDVAYAFIFERWEAWEKLPRDIYEKLDFIHPRHDFVLERPERLSAFGLPVRLWAVDDPAEVRALCALPHAESIRALMTNDIGLATLFPEP